MDQVENFAALLSQVPIEGVRVEEVGEDAPRCQTELRGQYRGAADSVLVVFAALSPSDVSPPERGTLH